MRSVAAVCEALGLPGPSRASAYAATDKGLMAEAFNRFSVPAPRAAVCSSEEELRRAIDAWPVPFILKPVDSSGSRGVKLLHDLSGLREAFDYSMASSRDGRVIAQEYLQGQEVSVEGFVIHGRVHVVAVTDKITTGPPHFVEMGHTQPSAVGVHMLEKIQRLVVLSVQALGLDHCAVHAEMMVTSDGPRMIEIGARLGGDFITSHLVSLSTGVDMVEALVEISLGLEPQLDRRFDRASAIRFLAALSPDIAEPRAIEELQRIPGVEAIHIESTHDQRQIRSSVDRLGHVIVGADTRQEAEANADRVLRLIRGVEQEGGS
nr:ATP-grasp domain-containing protein [Tessaracoccus massiliensis]